MTKNEGDLGLCSYKVESSMVVDNAMTAEELSLLAEELLLLEDSVVVVVGVVIVVDVEADQQPSQP